MSTRESVSAILKEIKPTGNLEGIQNLVEGGYIDSFELLALITTISERFGIEISIDDIIPENFNSVDTITRMVDSLIQKRG